MPTRRSTQLGDIDVAYAVLASIAIREASQVEGVEGFSNVKTSSKLKELLSRRPQLASRRGVIVEQDETGRIHIDLFVIAKYGINLQALARNTQQAVMEGLHTMTEADIADINVHISEIAIPKGDPSELINKLNSAEEDDQS